MSCKFIMVVGPVLSLVQTKLISLSSKYWVSFSAHMCVMFEGGVDSLVNVWQLNTHELHSSMEGHSAAVTCVAISPNGLFAISGSEDKTARVWGLTLGLVVSIFKVCKNLQSPFFIKLLIFYDLQPNQKDLSFNVRY